MPQHTQPPSPPTCQPDTSAQPMAEQQAAYEITRLAALMARLRDPNGGCPWDLEQTPQTLAPYAIEEAYEVLDAIQRQDWQAFPDELGDLLLQVEIGRAHV